ncbi:hypothetical protein PT974_10831 [Cladobotryum mycophilum]|uniref:Uncharacterized protein n=1 Tax=Cladobotryum mycophilum TaxID=491253 RepID=A0ABR0SCF5_9HYPO
MSATTSLPLATSIPSRTTETSTASSTRAILGPLTTVFNPPDYCKQCFIDPLSGTGSEIGICSLYKSRGMCTSQTLAECLPSATNYYDLLPSSAFYSPGLECPSGWQTMAFVSSLLNYNYVSPTNGVNPNTLLQGETAIICCPSGMTYYSTATHCIATSTPPSSISLTCSRSGAFKAQSVHGGFLSIDYQGASTTAFFPFGGIVAPPIQLNFRPQDRNSTSPPPLPPTTTSSLPINSSPSVQGNTISGGAIAGIVVGAVAFVGGIGAIVAWVWRRRRAKAAASDDVGSEYRKAELDATSKPEDHLDRTELETNVVYELEGTYGGGNNELPGDHTNNELSGDHTNNELPGDYTNNELPGDSVAIPRQHG